MATQLIASVPKFHDDTDDDFDRQDQCIREIALLLYELFPLMDRRRQRGISPIALNHIFDGLHVFVKKHEVERDFTRKACKKAMGEIFNYIGKLDAYELAIIGFHAPYISECLISELLPGGRFLTICGHAWLPSARTCFENVLHEMEIRSKLDSFFKIRKLSYEMRRDWIDKLPDCNAIGYSERDTWLSSRAKVTIYFKTEEDLALANLLF